MILSKSQYRASEDDPGSFYWATYLATGQFKASYEHSVLPVLSRFQELLLISVEETRRPLKYEYFLASLVTQFKMTVLFDIPEGMFLVFAKQTS